MPFLRRLLRVAERAPALAPDPAEDYEASLAALSMAAGAVGSSAPQPAPEGASDTPLQWLSSFGVFSPLRRWPGAEDFKSARTAPAPHSQCRRLSPPSHSDSADQCRR